MPLGFRSPGTFSGDDGLGRRHRIALSGYCPHPVFVLAYSIYIVCVLWPKSARVERRLEQLYHEPCREGTTSVCTGRLASGTMRLAEAAESLPRTRVVRIRTYHFQASLSRECSREESGGPIKRGYERAVFTPPGGDRA